MNAPAVGIKKIEQIDNWSFKINWTDGAIRHYRLSDLQDQCPCAHCVDEETGERRANSSGANADVRARRLYSIGRYAMRIEYTSGCSTGIYSYEFLHCRGVKE